MKEGTEAVRDGEPSPVPLVEYVWVGVRERGERERVVVRLVLELGDGEAREGVGVRERVGDAVGPEGLSDSEVDPELVRTAVADGVLDWLEVCESETEGVRVSDPVRDDVRENEPERVPELDALELTERVGPVLLRVVVGSFVMEWLALAESEPDADGLGVAVAGLRVWLRLPVGGVPLTDADGVYDRVRLKEPRRVGEGVRLHVVADADPVALWDGETDRDTEGDRGLPVCEPEPDVLEVGEGLRLPVGLSGLAVG